MITLQIAEDLRRAIDEAVPSLEALSDSDASRERQPGKWSPKQVIGHLIDSASNNHQRFVRAQFSDDLQCPGYQQDEWVAVQRYADADWRSLVALWREFNLHLARVIELTEASVAQKQRRRHNLDEVGFKSIRRDEPVTLAWFMADYVDHLRHHLKQIFG
jgi:hypothetical protein